MLLLFRGIMIIRGVERCLDDVAKDVGRQMIVGQKELHLLLIIDEGTSPVSVHFSFSIRLSNNLFLWKRFVLFLWILG